MTRPSFRFGAVLMLTALSSGCAIFRPPAKTVEVRPISTPQAVSPADADYAQAVGAIEQRDYATALELLQTARAHGRQDARVLNAFGVIYDKLGRFDLSARYYAEAQALDPGSTVVQANLAYSQELQRQFGKVDPLALPVRTASEPPAAAAIAMASTPVTVRPAVAAVMQPANAPAPSSPPAATRKPPPARATHTRLEIVNATGAPGGAGPARVSLAHRGWSASKARTYDGAVQSRTIIRYPQEKALIARALSRTLPRRAQLVACQSACRSVRLVLGQDARRWVWTVGMASVASPPRG